MKKEFTEEGLVLNELIQVNRDGFQGFWEASHEVTNKALQERLRKEAFHRNDYVVDLQREAFSRAVRPKKEGTFLGKIHRSWMIFRHRLNPRVDLVPLLECARGEQRALEVYQEVFESNLLPEIHPLLEEQFVSIIEARDMLRDVTAGQKENAQSRSVLHLL